MLQPNKSSTNNGPRKVLDAPIHLASMSAPTETDDLKSIWLQTRDDTLVNIHNFFPPDAFTTKVRNQLQMGMFYSLVATGCQLRLLIFDDLYFIRQIWLRMKKKHSWLPTSCDQRVKMLIHNWSRTMVAKVSRGNFFYPYQLLEDLSFSIALNLNFCLH